jgi:hypothetical protein
MVARRGGGEALDPESFVPLLERMRHIFLKHDFIGKATVLADLIDLAHLQASSFAEELGGGMMWGSAGSIADSVDLRRSLEPVDADTQRDSFELMRLLSRLAEQMKAQGVSSEGSEFVGNGFRRALEMLRCREPNA